MESRIIQRENLRSEAAKLKAAGWRLMLLSGVDWAAKDGTFEVLYHFAKLAQSEVLLVRVKIPHDDPRIPSLADLFNLADWHERETYDLFGIVFEGHQNLRRIFLPDDFTGHPLRKEYSAYKRMLPG